MFPALQANRPPWVFVLIAGNGLSRLYSTVVTAFTGATSPTLIELVRGTAPAAASTFSAPASELDPSRLAQTLKYTLKHWSWLLPLDLAGLVMIFLLWTLMSVNKVIPQKGQTAAVAEEEATKQQKNQVSVGGASGTDFTRVLCHF